MAPTYLSLNDEIWRECASWLTRWEILRYDHKANWPQSSISDLANSLRDGVLLCKLANKISPGCIDMKNVNLKPALAQFLCQRNINLFLKACKHNFGLKGSNLFEEMMLFEMTDFHKVLLTLSKLSESKKALNSGIKGFLAHVEKTADDEEIYHKLKTDLQNFEQPMCWYHKFTVNISQPTNPTDIRDSVIDSYSVDAEEIYQDLLEIRSKLEPSAIQNKKDFAIKEIYDTEKNYLAFLSKLMMSYKFPLQKIMNTDDHACIFHKIRELHDIHSPFFIELTKVITNPSKLGHIFLQFVHQFVIYGSYCANMTKATNLLQELCDRDKSFGAAVVNCESQVDRGKFKLQDLLKVPMQRVLKYDLLLARVIEETDKSRKEYAELCKAKEIMLDVANVINEHVRDVDHLNVINNLQESIVEWKNDADMKFSGYGKLIKDAEVMARDPIDHKITKSHIFIFNKCLLICKQIKGNRFAYRHNLNILEFDIKVDKNPTVNKSTKLMYHFSLVNIKDRVAHTIFVPTMEFKNKIIDFIKEAQDILQPKALSHTKHKLKLHTFDDPLQCGHCQKFLKGVIFQGYMCNRCKICLHKECIEFSKKCGMLRPPNGISDHDALKDKLWYVGEMDRRAAETTLGDREIGTFLVRIGKDSYVISLKTETSIEHMRISMTNHGPGDSKKIYLSGERYFSTLEELVVYYENYSLKENFDRLEEHTKLSYPFHQLRAKVIRDFDAQDRGQLSVKEGEVLNVIGKDGYRRGFWKGRTNNREIGYFPTSVVSLEGEVKFDKM